MAWQTVGSSNEDMCVKLKRLGVIKSERLFNAFRAVDRGLFCWGTTYPSNDEEINSMYNSAYADRPFRRGALHLSAPHMYATILDALDLNDTQGLSFLNIGSGSGYLSCLAATLMGNKGISHGIDVSHDAVAHASKVTGMWLHQLDKWKAQADAHPYPHCAAHAALHARIHRPIPLSLCLDFAHMPSWRHVLSIESAASDGQTHPLPPAPPSASSSSSASVRPGMPLSYSVGNVFDLAAVTAIDTAGASREGLGEPTPAAPSPVATYDRVYVGASCPHDQWVPLLTLLSEDGGVMVLPVDDELVRITRHRSIAEAEVDAAVMAESEAVARIEGCSAANSTRSGGTGGSALSRLCDPVEGGVFSCFGVGAGQVVDQAAPNGGSSSNGRSRCSSGGDNWFGSLRGGGDAVVVPSGTRYYRLTGGARRDGAGRGGRSDDNTSTQHCCIGNCDCGNTTDGTLYSDLLSAATDASSDNSSVYTVTVLSHVRFNPLVLPPPRPVQISERISTRVTTVAAPTPPCRHVTLPPQPAWVPQVHRYFPPLFRSVVMQLLLSRPAPHGTYDSSPVPTNSTNSISTNSSSASANLSSRSTPLPPPEAASLTTTSSTAAVRRQVCSVILPTDVLLHICTFCSRGWFRHPLRTPPLPLVRAPTAAPEPAVVLTGNARAATPMQRDSDSSANTTSSDSSSGANRDTRDERFISFGGPLGRGWTYIRSAASSLVPRGANRRRPYNSVSAEATAATVAGDSTNNATNSVTATWESWTRGDDGPTHSPAPTGAAEDRFATSRAVFDRIVRRRKLARALEAAPDGSAASSSTNSSNNSVGASGFESEPLLLGPQPVQATLRAGQAQAAALAASSSAYWSDSDDDDEAHAQRDWEDDEEKTPDEWMEGSVVGAAAGTGMVIASRSLHSLSMTPPVVNPDSHQLHQQQPEPTDTANGHTRAEINAEAQTETDDAPSLAPPAPVGVDVGSGKPHPRSFLGTVQQYFSGSTSSRNSHSGHESDSEMTSVSVLDERVDCALLIKPCHSLGKPARDRTTSSSSSSSTGSCATTTRASLDSALDADSISHSSASASEGGALASVRRSLGGNIARVSPETDGLC